MKFAALVGVCLLGPGCTHSSVHAQGGKGLAALVGAGMLLIAVQSERDRPEPYPPAMDEGRRVNAQDCRRPIDETAGNLKCR